MTRSGWYPDPTGRFPKRWYDGDDWTASVINTAGQQSYDALAAAAPAVPALPGSPSHVPPPPPAASPMPPPPPSQPAGPPQHSWQVPSGFSAASNRARVEQRRNSVALVVAGVAVGLFVVSLFVMDWSPSLSYGDLRTLVSDQDVTGLADNIVKLHMNWLGWAWAALVLVAFGVFVTGTAASHRIGHLLAALAAAIGAVLSAFVIVRMFRGPADPELGAWLLPAAYLVLLAAVVVSAQRDSA